MTASPEGRWGDPDVVGQYRTVGFSDPGEQAALAEVAAWAGGSVLDIGIGGGRTTALLSPQARAYVGIEVSAGMLALARSRWPGLDLRLGDVRSLGDAVGGDHDLVVFSFNGLDALDHPDRVTALAELARVVSPTGRVVVSSLNRDGVSFEETPFTLRARTPAGVVVEVARSVRHLRRTLTSVRHWRRTRALALDGATWAMRPMRAHEFRFVVHFATVGDTVRLLRDAGLDVRRAWSEAGEEVDLAAEHHDADYVHYVCAPTQLPADEG